MSIALDPIGNLLQFTETATPSQRRLLVPALWELAEAQRAGARLVAALRADQTPKIALFRADLHREFKILGHLVRVASELQGGLLTESMADVRKRVAEILAASHLKTWVKERLRPVFEYHYHRIAESTWKILSREGVPTTMRDEIEREIIQTGGKRIGLLDIPGDTKTALFNVIRESREKGFNPTAIGRLIEEFVPKGRFVNSGSTYRSQLIARTETLHAQRISSIASYRESPAVEMVVAFDGEEDNECADRNGEIFTFEEAEMEADGTHPNCVLCFAPVS